MRHVKLKNFSFLGIAYSSFIFLTQALACDPSVMLTKETFLEKTWFVHATPILPENNRSIAGVRSADHGYLRSREDGIHVRKTHHNCLGSLVPDANMAVSMNLWGIPIQYPMKKGHSETPYVLMEPIKDHLGTIVGGGVNDCFTFEDRSYGPNTVYLIPQEDIEVFQQKNPQFKGEIIPYEKGQIPIRDLVTQQLQRKGAWVYDFSGDPDPDFPEYGEPTKVKINGKEVDYKKFRAIFQELGWWHGNHNYHRLGRLETLFSYFNKAFWGCTSPTKTELKDLILPSCHAQVLRALINYEFLKLTEELKYLSSSTYQAFLAWKKDTLTWLDLYNLEYDLEKESKSLFINNPSVKEFFKARQDGESLKRLSQNLTKLSSNDLPNPQHMFSNDVGIALFVPEYWKNILEFRKPNEAQEVCQFVQASVSGWQDSPAVLTRYCLSHLFGGSLKPIENIDQELVKIFQGQASQIPNKTFHKTFKEDKDTKEGKDTFVKMYFKFYEPKTDLYGEVTSIPDDKKLLAITNIPQVKQGLSACLGIDHWYSLPEITLEEILKTSPVTQPLYGTLEDEYYEFANFLKPSFLERPVVSYPEGYNLARTFLHFTQELRLRPINPQFGNPFYKALAEQAGFPTGLALTYHLMQQGFFGSLEEIFTALGLKEEFRQTFATDEDFWNIKDNGYSIAGPTFQTVYQDLKRKKAGFN